MNVREIDDKIQALKQLKPGWDSYSGKRISPKALEEARRLLLMLNRFDFDQQLFAIVPCPDGSVQIEQHERGLDVEILVSDPEW